MPAVMKCAAAAAGLLMLSGFAPQSSGPEWVRHVIAEDFHTFTVSAADFTGDGLVDVIANGGPGDKDVLFVAPAWKPVVLHEGVKATHATVMDVNEDGRPDYVSSRFSPGLIYWLECPRLPLTEPWKMHLVDDSATGGVDGVHGLAVADLDRDGHADLIANSAGPGGGLPESIAWFSGPGLFKRHLLANHDAPGMSHYIGVGDVNRDGRPDVATGAKTGNWFAWWEAPPNPTEAWKKHMISETEPGATNIIIADLNGDGLPDFVGSHGHGNGLVWFEAPLWKRHELGMELAGPHSLAVGDVNGDGYPDLVTCAKDSKQVVWFRNDGKGHFTEQKIFEGQAAYELHLVDMDGDGDPDILLAGQDSRNIVWFENRLKQASTKKR